MEEIDLKELFEYIKDKLNILIFITVGVCLLGCIYGLLIQKPMYQSYTTVILGGEESGITTADITVSKNMIDTYAEIVKSRRVLDQVISELKLDLDYDELSSKISVTALNNTQIIKIIVKDVDAKLAKNVANVTAVNFAKEVVKLYNMDNVNILDEAIESEKPYNISVVKQVIIYFMIGFILGAGILFIVFYFDRTLKSTEQIETKIKLPILGSVQMLGKGGK
jgi:capsular polysaccharide biosynthesis protein